MSLPAPSTSTMRPPVIPVSRLRALAIRGLARMYRPEEGLFAFRIRRRGEELLLEGSSHRYTAMALIGLAGEGARFRMRGPGAIATTTNASHVRRFYLYVNEHSPRVFVKQCDFVSTVGWGRGGAGARRALGLPGGGPRYCVTPLAILDFEEQSKRLRLRSVHPGIAVEQVVANTGFALIVPERVPVTAAPTPEELDILRRRVDPQGLLRR